MPRCRGVPRCPAAPAACAGHIRCRLSSRLALLSLLGCLRRRDVGGCCVLGENIAVAYMAGRFARDIAAAGEAAMTDFAIDQLVEVFGSTIRREIKSTKTTGWCADPHIGGGYSSALVRTDGNGAGHWINIWSAFNREHIIRRQRALVCHVQLLR